MPLVTWARGREVAPARFVRVTLVAFVSLFVVVTSGALVRLTGSGLGCDNWPRCGSTPFPEKGGHAFIEFGNRVVALAAIVATTVAWIDSFGVTGLPRWVRRTALAVWVGAVAQIPLGGLTVVLHLHPLLVMAHFLLALAVLGGALVLTLEAWSHRDGRAPPAGPRWLRYFAVCAGLPSAVALVLTGAIATASGPHPGASAGVKRIGITITDTVYVHVRVVAAFGIGLLIVGWFLRRLRDEYPGLWRLWVALLAVFLAQGVVGEVQYRNALPWGLVLVHVFLAAAIWTLALAVAYTLWRPPAPLGRK